LTLPAPTSKGDTVTTEPIPVERIVELVHTLNDLFHDRTSGTDWHGWFSDQPEADDESTMIAAPGELCLTDGSAFVYDPGKRRWGHVGADVYRLPGDEDVDVVHPDQMTGEGVLATILANPEPPAWYEQP
jgi:hypothetical protein